MPPKQFRQYVDEWFEQQDGSTAPTVYDTV